MAKQVLKNCKLWYGGNDLSGDMNALAINTAAEMVSSTTFGSDSQQRLAGLKTTEMQHEGYYNAGAGESDEVLFDSIGGAGSPMTIGPETGADGEIAFISSVVASEYSPGGSVGEMMAFSFAAELAGDDLVKGTVMHNATRTAGGSGTARQLGAATADQKVYAALHVTSITGGTLTVSIDSDDNAGMTSAVTQGTFVAATTTGGEWLVIDGPITDDYWQVNWTYTGTTCDFVVVIGIL